jgi:hypothetical protein
MYKTQNYYFILYIYELTFQTTAEKRLRILLGALNLEAFNMLKRMAIRPPPLSLSKSIYPSLTQILIDFEEEVALHS